jgi:putative ABC transport system permease protein
MNDLPFLYSFLDQDYNRLYQSEEKLSKVVSVFSALAIFVACLGLFGLTSFTVQRKVKEIGIRKVLGASVGNLLFMLSTEFFRLIVVAFGLAIPVTYYMISVWLENFPEPLCC